MKKNLLIVLDERRKYEDIDNTDICILKPSKFKCGESYIEVQEAPPKKEYDFITLLYDFTDNVNDKLIEFKFAVETIKKIFTFSTLNLLVPYMPYMRQDETTDKIHHNSIKNISGLCQFYDFQNIYTFGTHSKVTNSVFEYTNFIDIALDTPYANSFKAKTTMAIKHILDGLSATNNVVILPDNGRENKLFFEKDGIGAEKIVFATKHKDADGVVSVSFNAPLEQMKDKNIIICNDVIDYGKSLMSACAALKKAGARKIIVFALHTLCDAQTIQTLKNCGVNNFVITDTIFNALQFNNDSDVFVINLVKESLNSFVPNEENNHKADLCEC